MINWRNIKSKCYNIFISTIHFIVIEWAAETVELCKKYFGKGVVGLDIAGDETFYPVKPNDEFVKAFQVQFSYVKIFFLSAIIWIALINAL